MRSLRFGRLSRRSSLGVLLCLLWAAPGLASEATGSLPTADAEGARSSSSLLRLVEDVARALEERAARERAAGPLRLEISGARGIDDRKADRAFGARLRRRLREGGVLLPVARAQLRARLVLSQEGGRVWAVGVLEGGKLPGQSPVAVSVPIDRELEVALGAVARPGPSRWTLERIGAVPPGVLDAVLVDVTDDLGDEIALLSVDGVRLYRFAPGDPRPSLVGGPYPLPGEREWPRVVSGWLAADANARLWIATSAGHSLIFDAKARRFAEAPRQGVPLRQPRASAASPGALLLVSGQPGSPVLSPPASTTEGVALDVEGLPQLVRDLLRWPARSDRWLFVDAEGRLGGRFASKRQVFLPIAERAGDRVVLSDLNADGAPELVTSAPVPPGEPDLVTLYELDATFSAASVVFRTPLGGGSVAAMAEGDLDFDTVPDLVLVEEAGATEAVLWRLEYAP